MYEWVRFNLSWPQIREIGIGHYFMENMSTVKFSVAHPYQKPWVSNEQLNIRPKKNNCLVVLHNFFWEGAGGQIFFFQMKIKATRNIYLHVYLPIKVQISLLYQKISLCKFKTSIKMYTSWKQQLAKYF